MNFLYFTNMYGIVFLLVILSAIIALINCSFQERIHVHKDKIHIKYEHQLNDGTSDFKQTVDIPFHKTLPYNCSFSNNSIYCLQWEGFAKFKIIKIDSHCEEYVYRSNMYNISLTVTFDIDKIHLYGGQGTENQTWPIESNVHIRKPFVSIPDVTLLLEPYWLTSSGFYLHIKEEVPLFITLNKKENIFRITAKQEIPFIRTGDTVLIYKVCKFDNMRLAQEHAAVNVFGKPKGIPDTRMTELPIWTTWARFKLNVSQNIVLDFAKNITRYGFPNSQLEIDDKWESCYGSFNVDTKAFPNMKNLVKELKSLGYRVTLWAHPFVSNNCEPYYSEGIKLKYFVNSTKNTIETRWWHGIAGYIDFTNPEAVRWWQARLNKMREEYGIDSFKFDAGESGWHIYTPIFNEMRSDHPETNLKAYNKAVTYFGNMIEVRAARDAHQYPTYIRMMDLNSQWRGINSMSTMIPVLLHMNIIGYPFALPDIVGGYVLDGVLPKELFIRWLQVNTFMPTLQLSYPPWEFDEDTTRLAKKFINLHIKYAQNIVKAMKQTTETGSPVNPPIWWIDPTDPVAQIIDSEFLVGEDILVAPVIEEGARSRDIYLPKGVWKDEVKGDIVKGPIWLRNYSADLEVLPYFSKLSSGVNSVLPVLKIIFCSIIISYKLPR